MWRLNPVICRLKDTERATVIITSTPAPTQSQMPAGTVRNVGDVVAQSGEVLTDNEVGQIYGAQLECAEVHARRVHGEEYADNWRVGINACLSRGGRHSECRTYATAEGDNRECDKWNNKHGARSVLPEGELQGAASAHLRSTVEIYPPMHSGRPETAAPAGHTSQ